LIAVSLSICRLNIDLPLFSSGPHISGLFSSILVLEKDCSTIP
jgi:hypothetical protein